MPSLTIVPLLLATLAMRGDTTRAMRQVAAELPSLVRADTGRYGLLWSIETDSGTGALGRFAREHRRYVVYLTQYSPAVEGRIPAASRDGLRREVARRLAGDTALLRTLGETLERSGALPDGRRPMPEPRAVSFQRVIDVAARFFYPDSILPNGRIQSHMCAGINGIVDMQGGRDPAVEAFAFSALFHELDAPKFYLDGDFGEAARLVNAMDLSSDPTMRLRRAQGAMWALMVRSEKLRQVLLTEYERTRSHLPFRIVDAPASERDAARR